LDHHQHWRIFQNKTMDKASKSVFYFGIYILITGLTLLLAPSILLKLLMIDDSPNIWMQLLGLALCALGYYYSKAARDNNIDFYKGTIPVRIAQLGVVILLVWIYDGPYILIGVSGIEALAGIITYTFMRKA
jgi:hypothetical protein